MQFVSLMLVAAIIARGNAAYTMNVRVHSYQSDDKCPVCNDFAAPGCCDQFSNTRTCTGWERCDNTFFYCLRDFGTVASLNTAGSERCGNNDPFGKLSGVNIDSASLNFSQDTVLGLPNPIPLRGRTIRWAGIQLYVEVKDADYASSDELIDRFSINIDQIPIGNETTPTVYNGTFGFASLTLSFRVECFLSYYYPDCEPNGCQNFGNCTCFPGYTGVDCEDEIDECVEANCPEDTICEDGLNSFTCRPLATISPSVTDDCIGINCSGRGVCVDGVDSFRCACDPGYTGGLCDVAIPSTSDENTASAPSFPVHVVLCIVAVVLVVFVLLAINTIQFVQIKKNSRDIKNGSPHHDAMPTFLNGSYNILEDARSANGNRKITPPALNSASHHGVHRDRMNSNMSYNLPHHTPYTAPDTKRHGVLPTPEHVEYATRVPNSHHKRPQKLDIYRTSPTNIEIRMADGAINDDDNTTPGRTPSDSETDLPITSGMASRAPMPTDTEGLKSGEGSQGEEYFPMDAIATEESPAYNAPIDCPTGERRRISTDNTSAPTPEPISLMSTWTDDKPPPQEAVLQPEATGDNIIPAPEPFRIMETPI